MEMYRIEWQDEECRRQGHRYVANEIEADFHASELRKNRPHLIVKKYPFNMPTEPGHMADFLNRLTTGLLTPKQAVEILAGLIDKAV